MQKPYHEQVISLANTMVFNAGETAYVLKSTTGAVYVMTSYLGGMHEEVTFESLATLGARLNLPAGWSFSSWKLDAPLRIVSTNLATMLQDENNNGYQKLP
jgi:haloalkane dehalogenase